MFVLIVALHEVDWAGRVGWYPAVYSGVALHVGVGMSNSTLRVPCALRI